MCKIPSRTYYLQLGRKSMRVDCLERKVVSRSASAGCAVNVYHGRPRRTQSPFEVEISAELTAVGRCGALARPELCSVENPGNMSDKRTDRLGTPFRLFHVFTVWLLFCTQTGIISKRSRSWLSNSLDGRMVLSLYLETPEQVARVSVEGFLFMRFKSLSVGRVRLAY